MTAQKLSEIPKAYDPQKVETKWYQFWLEKGYFTPKIDSQKEPFVIIMPPPNVTGELHLGHALTATLEDIMIRWHRMKGDPTLWLPGIDHAGIAAQVVVEQTLTEEGVTRHDLGREEFLERMWQWMKQYSRVIAEQHKRLGASCDWSRERFTMDEGPSRAVRITFVRLYEKGLIYRGERIINWCPRCTTALSDLEVEHVEETGHLYYVNYRLAGEDGFITVATTRPETILGDTAVAVNPRDKRYKGMVDRRAILPAIGREIPVIADEAVDPSFGTGAVKVTPAHDPVDFEIGQQHDLPSVNILNPDGTMNENAGPYKGLDRFACREQLLADLESEGLMVKVERHQHSVGHCCRCNTVIEPWASQQWFIKISPLAIPAIDAVTDGRIKIIPERFIKVYLNWLENIRDWCISRQLWWGHRIPVWYCGECGQLTVTIDDPRTCIQCGSSNIVQDPDVLDTWFSSALWPHSTLGWPDATGDFDYFYPTSVMETGYDILFFWVARMIMMGLENTGEVPFNTVYLHGLVRDEKGEKMSKVKGNVLNPLDAIESYGTDALRLALSTGTSPGNDIRLSKGKLEAARNFANKLWNASRFILGNMEEGVSIDEIERATLPLEDRWILSRLNRLVASVESLMSDFQFGEAQRQIHDFIWGEFCDWYIEMSKIRLKGGERGGESEKGERSPTPVLAHVLETSLRLLHPFMPFITEEIWQSLKGHLDYEMAESIMVSPYPAAEEEALDDEAEKQMAVVIEIVRAIRNARAEFRVAPARWIEAVVAAAETKPAIETQAQAIETLARVRPLTIIGTEDARPAGGEGWESGKKAKMVVLEGAEVILPMAGMVDLEAERARLKKESAGNQAEIARIEARLKDQSFLSKAPPDVVERERERLAAQRDRLMRLGERLSELG
ncbi:MAG: valine--tRNA ligase [Dehalococcoidia bacterium]|nr:MAG: valine--tRNA ligase [Dehalococcoidia bacterium]